MAALREEARELLPSSSALPWSPLTRMVPTVRFSVMQRRNNEVNTNILGRGAVYNEVSSSTAGGTGYRP